MTLLYLLVFVCAIIIGIKYADRVDAWIARRTDQNVPDSPTIIDVLFKRR